MDSDSKPVQSNYLPIPELAVINPEALLEQAEDWPCAIEFLSRMLVETEASVTELNEATAGNEHRRFWCAGRRVKESALCLYLPALIDVGDKAFRLGQQLESLPNPSPELLSMRKPLIQQMEVEFQRLNDYLPEAWENAAAQAERGAELARDENEGGNGEEEVEDEYVDEDGNLVDVEEDENGNIIDKDENYYQIKDG